jgi:hypothetical protein
MFKEVDGPQSTEKALTSCREPVGRTTVPQNMPKYLLALSILASLFSVLYVWLVLDSKFSYLLLCP